MSQENKVLCGANSYEEKYFFNPEFAALPSAIKDELKVMCVLFVTEVGGILLLEFEEDGSLYFRVSSQENDFFFDEIGSELRIKELQKEKEELLASCRKLSELRKSAAKQIEERVNQDLKELNFRDAEFQVSFGQKEGEIVLTEHGMDQVEFLIRSNKGEKLKPLAKIASGGEISRIMLALKTAIGDCDRIPTLIFDEIDSGISGITASVVGKKLHSIAEKHQVICITHLAQIAACGDYHYRIEKHEEGERIETSVTPLGKEETVQEIARLLGGMNITETTLESARELLAFSGE